MENAYSKYIGKRVKIITSSSKGDLRHQGKCTDVNDDHFFLDDEISNVSKFFLISTIIDCAMIEVNE